MDQLKEKMDWLREKWTGHIKKWTVTKKMDQLREEKNRPGWTSWKNLFFFYGHNKRASSMYFFL